MQIADDGQTRHKVGEAIFLFETEFFDDFPENPSDDKQWRKVDNPARHLSYAIHVCKDGHYVGHAEGVRLAWRGRILRSVKRGRSQNGRLRRYPALSETTVPG